MVELELVRACGLAFPMRHIDSRLAEQQREPITAGGPSSIPGVSIMTAPQPVLPLRPTAGPSGHTMFPPSSFDSFEARAIRT